MNFFEMFEQVKNKLEKTDVSGAKQHIAVQIEVTEDGNGIFYAEIIDGIMNVQPYNYYDNDVSLVLSNDTLTSILSGKITFSEAIESGKLNAYGCPKKATIFYQAVEATVKSETASDENDKNMIEEVKTEPEKEIQTIETEKPVTEVKSDDKIEEPVKTIIAEEKITAEAVKPDEKKAANNKKTSNSKKKSKKR